jgi:putative peptidoglycan lipid II flippase
VKIAVGVLIFTQLANLALVPLIGQAGLTVSISLGALANAAFLLAGLRRVGTYKPSPGWGGLTWRVLLACTVMGAALFAAARGFDWIALGQHNLQRIGLLAICLAGAATLYFATLLATGIRPREFMRRG